MNNEKNFNSLQIRDKNEKKPPKTMNLMLLSKLKIRKTIILL